MLCCLAKNSNTHNSYKNLLYAFQDFALSDKFLLLFNRIISITFQASILYLKQFVKFIPLYLVVTHNFSMLHTQPTQ